MARSVGRARGHRSFMERVFGLRPKVRDIAAEDLREPAEDVWKSLRF